jgi:polyhydroxybutyrate depolymerase
MVPKKVSKPPTHLAPVLVFYTATMSQSYRAAAQGVVVNLSLLCLILHASWAPAGAQTQYQFVPGSRQARPVTNTQPQASQYGYGQAPGGYAPVPRSGGMQLRSAPLSSVPVQTAQPASQYVQQRSTATPTANDKNAGSGKKAYDFTDTFSQDGVSRLYRVHIPASYDRSRATPVVLAFHGLGMNSMAMLAMSGLNGLSDRKGFIVVYGEGVNNRWNDGSGGADDIGYVSSVLQRLSRVANVDTRRVYACGISNGGFFAQRLACNLPDKIAAIGVVASSMMAGSQMAGGTRMPAIFFLGTDDPLLPWGDGRNKALGKLGESLGLGGLGSIDNPMARMGGLMSVPEMVAFWTNINGCGGSPSVNAMPDTDHKDGTTVKKETYGNGDVVVYVIDGGGHTWPGMIELKSFKDLCGVTSQDIDASELMWEFFERRAR